MKKKSLSGNKNFILFFLFSLTLINFFSISVNNLHAKNFDCFTFNDEIDLLKIRLHEMNPYIDYFVIVESTKNKNGEDKPLYYENNKEKFSDFKEKIIHIKTNDRFYLFNKIKEGLQNANPEDLIFISDVSEIIKRTSMPYILTIMDTIGSGAFGICQQQLFSCYFNTLCNKRCHGTAVFHYSLLKFTDPYISDLESIRALRDLLKERKDIIRGMFFHDSGWCFHSIKGIHNISIDSWLRNNQPSNFPWFFIENLSSNLPIYVQENHDFFTKNNYFLNEELEIEYLKSINKLIKIDNS